MLRHDIERRFRRAVDAFSFEIIVPAVFGEHVNVGLSHARIGEPPDAKKLKAISRVGVIVLAPSDGLGFAAQAKSRVCTHRRSVRQAASRHGGRAVEGHPEAESGPHVPRRIRRGDGQRRENRQGADRQRSVA